MNFIDEIFFTLAQKNPIIAEHIARHQEAQKTDKPLMWVQTLEAMVIALAEQNEPLTNQLSEADIANHS